MAGAVEHISLPSPLLRRSGALADRTGRRVYVVGGYVRDSILGREDQDIDIVVMGDGIAFAR